MGREDDEYLSTDEVRAKLSCLLEADLLRLRRMAELQAKFKQVSTVMTMELDKEEAKLYNRRLKDEDLTEYRNISNTKGTDSRLSGTRRASTSAIERTGDSITGPGAKSSAIPIPGTGVKISWKRMTASLPMRSTG